ncbi:MAG: helix-turn-helix domain-containing protein [Okeania sp. SIO2C9]|uniref:helix-turn-helix domain-containing protein n=1 Tax=Okeania sp. SIO2C9 TaxID=2607791 RepID=UPI0013C07CC5|nr:helix-turn-helix domain-containing protein [Okeania sp. SIO2C9]
MLLKYKYKLKPHKRQTVIIANWLELARKQYNYRLAERVNWFEATRTPVKACPLNVSVGRDVACNVRTTDLSKYSRV